MRTPLTWLAFPFSSARSKHAVARIFSVVRVSNPGGPQVEMGERLPDGPEEGDVRVNMQPAHIGEPGCRAACDSYGAWLAASAPAVPWLLTLVEHAVPAPATGRARWCGLTKNMMLCGACFFVVSLSVVLG